MTEPLLPDSAGRRRASPSALDLYLSPHSDDICFSLSGLAHARHTGTLLTILPLSGYVAVLPRSVAPPPDEVTRMRKAEDMAFAEACGLRARFLNLRCASLLGHASRDLSWAQANAQRIEPVLTKALHNHASHVKPGERPWLFCPSGIGRHVDHVAVRTVIVRNFDRLTRRYRIGFYEDLHYASQTLERAAGIAALQQALPHRTLRRIAFPLGEAAATKLSLLALYRSQFIELPTSLLDYSPAPETATPPHEAIWTDELCGDAPALN